MPLGISPLVDFAFKKIFGSPENVQALIGLLNAVLCLEHPIVSVEILNPFNYQEFKEAKQIILDVRARDTTGRMLNVELQVAAFPGLLQRLTYYACSMYVEQLERGDDYHRLCSAISICFVNQNLHSGSAQAHHWYQMVDRESGRTFGDGIEVHTVELPKYNLREATIAEASPLEQWAFFLLNAHRYDADRLRELLPAVEFQTAIIVVERIAEKTEDRVMYDQRERAIRDYEWSIASARDEGREQGMEKGSIAGQIQLTQDLLDEPPQSLSDLQQLSIDELNQLLAELRTRLHDRLA
ncbi:Rpn family recombination-promoting nuclease/putative transposase [Rosistilla oblonga]|uniref:Rpn family recombination-promoting nuclease/putative transposase n=1 Tax=Rosistilla oblonga TaxID=2527990 RepID=UPI003A9841BD